MHGLGNDYVFVSTFDHPVDDPSGLARVVSDRHRGVGSDGLILVAPSASADVRMEMYNADGSRGEMCGNGIRCVGKFVVEKGMVVGGGRHGGKRQNVKTSKCANAETLKRRNAEMGKRQDDETQKSNRRPAERGPLRLLTWARKRRE